MELEDYIDYFEEREGLRVRVVQMSSLCAAQRHMPSNIFLSAFFDYDRPSELWIDGKILMSSVDACRQRLEKARTKALRYGAEDKGVDGANCEFRKKFDESWSRCLRLYARVLIGRRMGNRADEEVLGEFVKDLIGRLETLNAKRWASWEGLRLVCAEDFLDQFELGFAHIRSRTSTYTEEERAAFEGHCADLRPRLANMVQTFIAEELPPSVSACLQSF